MEGGRRAARGRGWRRWAWLTGGLLGVAWLALSARLFVWPPLEPPAQVDAVVALGGGEGQRVAVAVALVRARDVPVLVVPTGPNDETRAAGLVCGQRSGRGPEVLCFEPVPDSTLGEARAVAALARARGWRSVAVVTSTYHVTRAGLLFRRCLDARVRTVAAPLPRTQPATAWAVLREWLALAAAGIERGCAPPTRPPA